MLIPLLEHELQNLLKSRRIYLTVTMFLLLFATVFIVRAIDFQKQINQYNDDVMLNDKDLREATNYSQIKPRAIQKPIIFSIFNEGFKIPRVITIQYYEPITNTMTLNEETNLLYNESTQLDITFLITFFLSLFILLISYDSVNGEKQVGTLRILMTYPLKRQSFILKKTLGVFFFVALTFTIPYFLSIMGITYHFVNVLSLNFFLSAIFYWFLVMLFIMFFSLLGIFISCCTTNPNRSLVYCLLVWIMFSIVLPISWDYIIAPRLYNDTLTQLSQGYRDKIMQAQRIMYNDVPDEANINLVGHMNWSGRHFFYETNVAGWKATHEQHHRYQMYIYENYFPVTRDAEQAYDEIQRKRIYMENVRNWVFFYNPIVLFNSLSAQITGNSREDLLRFLHTTRELRDELVNLGVSEEWLLDSRFFIMYELETDVMYNITDQYDLFMLIYEYAGGHGPLEDFFNEIGEERAVGYLQEMVSQQERYNMVLPRFRRYEQPIYTFSEIFARILQYLVVFVVSILVLWVMTWRKFLGFDVR
ncbi:MAG: ABC transporter permease [Candidatus Cloacimonetes bacterium]|nr:ABC transporter permease [Candidatus Cloacimonadota bacterium]